MTDFDGDAKWREILDGLDDLAMYDDRSRHINLLDPSTIRALAEERERLKRERDEKQAGLQKNRR